MNRSLMRCFALVALLFCASSVQGQVIRATAAGSDSFTTAGFWTVLFQSGAGSIQSVSFDLTADVGAFFDFDGGSSFSDATTPVLGALTGLTAADVSSAFSSPVDAPNHPAVLTFNFAAGSFVSGDSLAFGADTDFFVADPTPGGAVGQAPAVFRVTLAGGGTLSAPFVTINSNLSAVEIIVPEPAAIATLASGLIALTALRSRRVTRAS
jgi:hypothetical protein